MNSGVCMSGATDGATRAPTNGARVNATRAPLGRFTSTTKGTRMIFLKRLFGSQTKNSEKGTATGRQHLPVAPGRWQRTGKSIDEDFMEKKAKYETSNSSYTQIFDPSSLIQGSQPAMFTVCAANKQPIVAVKVQIRSEDREALCSAVNDGHVWLKCNCFRYPPFPVVYTRLFIPLTYSADSGPGKIGMRGTIAENAGKFTNADFQDWLINLHRLSSSQVWVFDTSEQLLAKGDITFAQETVNCIIGALDEADAMLRSIAPAKQDFNAAAQAFFRDHPEPSF